jgi:hypothetical protein
MHLKNILQINKVASGHVFVSTNNTFDNGWETMVFECDDKGKPTNWTELDCDRYSDESEARNGHKLIVAKWGKLAPLA